MNMPIITATISIIFHKTKQAIEWYTIDDVGHSREIEEQAIDGSDHNREKLDMAQTSTHGARTWQTEKEIGKTGKEANQD